MYIYIYIYIYVMILRFLSFIQTFLKYCKALSTEKYKRYINILLLLLLLLLFYVLLHSDGKAPCFFGKKMPFVWEKFVDVKNCPELWENSAWKWTFELHLRRYWARLQRNSSNSTSAGFIWESKRTRRGRCDLCYSHYHNNQVIGLTSGMMDLTL